MEKTSPPPSACFIAKDLFDSLWRFCWAYLRLDMTAAWTYLLRIVFFLSKPLWSRMLDVRADVYKWHRDCLKREEEFWNERTGKNRIKAR